LFWAWFLSPIPLSMFVLHSPCSISWIFWRERSHHTWSFIFMEWVDDTILSVKQ
jgi:hypothetical protein